MVIPIGAGEIPASAEELQQRIGNSGGVLGLNVQAQVRGPQWPELDSIELDLSGSEMPDPARFPRPESREEMAWKVNRFDLKADPITVRGMPCKVHSQANDTTWKTARLSDGGRALVLDRAAAGTVELTAQRSDLERLAHELLIAQAGKHGVNVTETKVVVTSRDRHSLALQVDVTAKMMMMKTTLTVTGDASVDDGLQLRLSNLKLSGGGVAATLARGFLQPHFDRLQQQPIPLASSMFGEIRLHDVSLDVAGDDLRIKAMFGA